MSDQDPNKPNDAEPKEYPFWPDSLNASDENADKQAPRGVNKFAWLRKALIAIGKLAGQSFISWMLFSLLFILLINPSMWGSDQNYLAVEEIVKLITSTISVFLAVRIIEDTELAKLGLKLNRRAFHDFTAGLFISFSFLAIRFLFYWGLGWITIKGFAWQNVSLGNVI